MKNLFIARNEAYAHYRNFREFIRVDRVVKLMMDRVGVNKKYYAIGGSYAMIAYGIDIKRTPHDVDVIVDLDMLPTIYNLMRYVPEIGITINTNAAPSPYYRRLSISYYGYDIDILGHKGFTTVEPPMGMSTYCYVDSLDNVVAAKRSYGRKKDIEDIVKIQEFLGEV